MLQVLSAKSVSYHGLENSRIVEQSNAMADLLLSCRDRASFCSSIWSNLAKAPSDLHLVAEVSNPSTPANWSIFPQDGVVGAHIGMLLSQSRQLADIIKTVPHSTDPIQVSIEGNRTIITCYVYFISFVCYFLVFSSRLFWQGRVSKLSLLPKSWSALDHVSLMRYIIHMNWLFEIIWIIDIGTIWIIDIWM